MRALNVFYYLTYEGAVSLSSIADPVLREVSLPAEESGLPGAAAQRWSRSSTGPRLTLVKRVDQSRLPRQCEPVEGA